MLDVYRFFFELCLSLFIALLCLFVCMNNTGSQRSALKGASPAGTPRSNNSVTFGGPNLPTSFAGGLKMPKIRIPKVR
jgi:hypothetical protein